MYQLEAERYSVEQIKNNSDMPTLAKAACINDAKRILREYRSQHNVFLQSLKFINDSANPEIVEVYSTRIDNVILNYNTDFYYQSREYIFECYKEGKICAYIF